MQNNFAEAFALVKQQFIQVINTMDSIKLFGNFSILEFFIALLVLGGILPIVIITISNWSSDSYSATLSSDRRDSRNKIYNEDRQIRNAFYKSHTPK